MKVHLHHFSISIRSHKTAEIKVFLTIFAWWWSIRSRIRRGMYNVRDVCR